MDPNKAVVRELLEAAKQQADRICPFAACPFDHGPSYNRLRAAISAVEKVGPALHEQIPAPSVIELLRDYRKLHTAHWCILDLTEGDESDDRCPTCRACDLLLEK